METNSVFIAHYMERYERASVLSIHKTREGAREALLKSIDSYKLDSDELKISLDEYSDSGNDWFVTEQLLKD